MLKRFIVSFVFLIYLFTLALSAHCISAEPFALVVQGAEIAPAVVTIGEPVSVNMTIKNVGTNTTSCSVTTFCGDCVVGVHEIPTIPPRDSIPLSFKLNTSSLSTGVHSIETLIEKPSGEHKIFDLGNLTIEQEASPIPDDVTNPQPDSTNPPDPTNTPPATTTPYLDWPHALLFAVSLPLASAGVIGSILIMRKRTSNISSELSLRKSRDNSQKPAIYAVEPTREMKELEREFEKQFGLGKVKISLIACAAVLALAISSLWFLLL